MNTSRLTRLQDAAGRWLRGIRQRVAPVAELLQRLRGRRPVEVPDGWHVAPPARGPAGWELLAQEAMPTAVPLALEPGGTLPLQVVRPVCRTDDEPPPPPWSPGDPWLPVVPKRVATRDYRKGYAHVWALEDYTAKVRRPYLLRMDLARVPFKDTRTVEQKLTTVPLPGLSFEASSIALPVLEPAVSPMTLAAGPPRLARPSWSSIISSQERARGAPESTRPAVGAAPRSGADADAGEALEAEGRSGGDDG